jgi:hypothetical protein
LDSEAFTKDSESLTKDSGTFMEINKTLNKYTVNSSIFLKEKAEMAIDNHFFNFIEKY